MRNQAATPASAGFPWDEDAAEATASVDVAFAGSLDPCRHVRNFQEAAKQLRASSAGRRQMIGRFMLNYTNFEVAVGQIRQPGTKNALSILQALPSIFKNI